MTMQELSVCSSLKWQHLGKYLDIVFYMKIVKPGEMKLQFSPRIFSYLEMVRWFLNRQ